jgi:hypothetical protein
VAPMVSYNSPFTISPRRSYARIALVRIVITTSVLASA